MPMDSSERPEPHHVGKLPYATPPAVGTPGWVWVILTLYALLLLGVVIFPVGIGISNAPGLIGVYLIIGFLFAGGLLLVSVPVRARRQRGSARRAIWLPLAGSTILAAALCYGAGTATLEFLNPPPNDTSVSVVVLSAVVLIWLAWIVVFWLMSRSFDPVSFSVRLYKAVLAGSVLELLIAIPMHIVVRRRQECCAGFATGFAICLGVVVAIISLGPGICFLFHRRWYTTYRSTLPARDDPHEPSVASAKRD